MPKLIAFVGGGLLGTMLGFVIGIFVYPYIFLADIVADEQLLDPDSRRVVATGTFIHANPSDPVHYGIGGVTLYDSTQINLGTNGATRYDSVLRLESDFEVGPGPKFHVYLVPKDRVTDSADVEGTMYIDLGRLRAFKGSQNYPVPAGVDLKDFGSVVIWCEKFGVLISPATLTFEG